MRAIGSHCPDAPAVETLEPRVMLTAAPLGGPLPIEDVTRWAYQLQNVSHVRAADVVMPGLVRRGATIRARRLHAGTNVSVGSHLASFTAARWDAGTLTAPSASLVSIQTPGDVSINIPRPIGKLIPPDLLAGGPALGSAPAEPLAALPPVAETTGKEL